MSLQPCSYVPYGMEQSATVPLDARLARLHSHTQSENSLILASIRYIRIEYHNVRIALRTVKQSIIVQTSLFQGIQGHGIIYVYWTANMCKDLLQTFG